MHGVNPDLVSPPDSCFILIRTSTHQRIGHALEVFSEWPAANKYSQKLCNYMYSYSIFHPMKAPCYITTNQRGPIYTIYTHDNLK